MEQRYLGISLILTMVVVSILWWCSPKTSDQGSQNPWSWYNSISTWSNHQANMETLSPDQISWLVYLIQEEKLARDVYSVLYETRGIKIFDNILRAEVNHQMLVAQILSRYNITDPTTDRQIWEFVDTQLQDLYTKLISQWKQSPDQALNVGIAIETQDIQDIQQTLQLFDDKPDIQDILHKLLSWSQRHLQAFSKN